MRLTRSITQRFHSIASSSFTRKEANLWRCVVVKTLKKSYPVHNTNIVSTIGAGDNFNAGFIFGMLKYGITRDDLLRGLTEEQWDKAINCGLDFSADCCKDIFNYVSREFGEQMKG